MSTCNSFSTIIGYRYIKCLNRINVWQDSNDKYYKQMQYELRKRQYTPKPSSKSWQHHIEIQNKLNKSGINNKEQVVSSIFFGVIPKMLNFSGDSRTTWQFCDFSRNLAEIPEKSQSQLPGKEISVVISVNILLENNNH